MANNTQLDAGFEEVALDEGFEEIPVEGAPAPVEATPSADSLTGKAIEQSVSANPLSIGAGIAKYNINLVNKLRGKDERPWKEVLTDVQEPMQTGQDFAQAGLQGFTLGGLDEAGGALAAGAKKLTGDERAISDIYRDEQRSGEVAYKQAKERSPTATTTGEISGAVAQGVLMPTVGVEGALGKLAGSVGMKTATKGLTGGTKILAGAKELGKQLPGVIAETATLGAVQGGLSSEGELGTDQFGQDVKGGALLGGLFGGGGKAVAEGAPLAASPLLDKAGKIAQDSPFLSQISRGFKRGQTGDIVSEGQESLGKVTRQESSAVKDLSNRFINAENDIGKQLKNSIEQASVGRPEQGVLPVIIDVTPEIDDATRKLVAFGKNSPTINSGKDFNDITDKIFLLKNNKLNPIQAWQLKDDVYKLAKGVDNPELRAITDQLASGIKNQLKKKVPGFEQLNDQFFMLRKSGRETLMAKGSDPDFSNKFISDFSDAELKTYNNAEWLLEKLRSPGSNKLDQQKALNFLEDNLLKTEVAHPGTIKKLGYDNIEAFKADIVEKADDFAMNRSILGQDPKGEGLSTIINGAWKLMSLGASPTARGAIYTGAQKTGQLSTKVKKPLQSLYKLPKETHAQMANTMLNSENKLAQQYGKMLQDAIDNNNSTSRNAALFVIQQNPDLRKMANDILPGEGENEQQ